MFSTAGHILSYAMLGLFLLGNGTTENLLSQKSQTIPGALSGISNSSLSLALNFPLDTYCKQMQTSNRTIKC